MRTTLCDRLGIEVPIIQAPMAGGWTTPALVAAVSEAGGFGMLAGARITRAQLEEQITETRRRTGRPFGVNFQIAPTTPTEDDDPGALALLAEMRRRLGLSATPTPVPPSVPVEEAIDLALASGVRVISLAMGSPEPWVAQVHAGGGVLMAAATTVAEAEAAEQAGADMIVAQGAEAGGHRGCFDAALAERQMVGLFSLLPAVVDAVRLPVVATGGIADPRGVAAALALGASAAQIGTGFLRSPEAKIAPAWADALARTAPEATMVSRAFSGRAGRSIATDYVRAATAPDAPAPAPYPVQRGLTGPMRAAGTRAGDVHRMQPWAGQSAALARAAPAADLVREFWDGARAILG
jgi:nitronate monooxygenase